MYSASELMSLFFFGTPLVDVNGNKIEDEAIEFYIEAAGEQIQNMLAIKLNKQAYEQSKNYYYDDWIKWGYIKTSYPVVAGLQLKGFIGTSLQVSYPDEWLSFKTQSPDEYSYHRSLALVPISGSATGISGISTVLLGISPYTGFWGHQTVPNYWSVRYITGFNKVPADILEALGKRAAISAFTILSDIVLGPGVASKSQGIDGLSQSINTTASALYGAFSARVNQYEKDLKRLESQLKGKYKGISFVMA